MPIGWTKGYKKLRGKNKTRRRQESPLETGNR